jgi:hypothetical protein
LLLPPQGDQNRVAVALLSFPDAHMPLLRVVS